ncbi:MAG: MogA/MoaB family molybdenum cofactor biosynthesis protein [Acidobacteriota bacterium]|nr:MogA/MoaB family molybdenum cofactor biosynthesis protein [Acidobacteriota bacterium]
MGIKIQAVAITVSDSCSRGEAEDVSGAVLVECLREIGAEIAEQKIVSDDFEPLIEVLKTQSERKEVNLIITTGGTGFAHRDTTPEATRAVIEREAPGLAEAMRLESLRKTPTAMLSRAVCGIRGNCLIVNLPGSPKAVRECFDVIKPVLPHAVALLAGQTEH